ncbi:MAG: hypothetical protein K9G67_02490 [Bacteroidales bacterium]|nr:hypothetical protein [Bacteroidales bacterium]MCF8344025.1 hypothetical protein [Bacteroidales bacterium]MCF8350039.1 hypothetical protein [Bacteroidales bacterium]MCF8375195.1 hypothetical protein [Bacteroidales bacterium]MCF8400683.1 hypothetical protein [Bacteroidales bacterium]
MRYIDFRRDAGGIAAREHKGPLWYFLPENDGAFLAPFAEYISGLYFPLMNRHGLKSFVNPELKGDIASSFRNYLTAATVSEELHRNVSSRNFWVKPKGQKPWSASGNSAFQKTQKWTGQHDESEIEGRIGAFISRRRNKALGIESEIKVFVPDSDDYVELMKVTIKNISDNVLNFTPYSATPIFGRHPDNFRDHRQVTTMFQKVIVEKHGVRVKPSIVHDENGHSINNVHYAVLGFDEHGESPSEVWPVMSDFIGEGGSLDNPEAVSREMQAPYYSTGQTDGKEAIGAIGYRAQSLMKGEVRSYIIIHGITENANDLQKWENTYGSSEQFDLYYKQTLDYWQRIASGLSVKTANDTFDNWVKWVNFQLKCRQIFGNSYLPDFGYGRGGRGWRDLWQDLLSIFLVDPDSARSEIINSLKGVRIDGSNATIIGTEPGTFIADRNNIPRNWCDHGAWPAFVVNFYIQQSGDLDILFHEIPYWKDHLVFRTRKKDEAYYSTQGEWQKTRNDEIYKATIFEHLLIQQLSAFYHVGDHNILLLEGGDWNDTYDMAREKGESTGFYAFYAENLRILAHWLETMSERGVKHVSLLKEIGPLVDNNSEIEYSPGGKQKRIRKYFAGVAHKVSGEKIDLDVHELRKDLVAKANHIAHVIRTSEWIDLVGECGFFNGHYDNNGDPVDGPKPDGVRMDLTTQVMAIMHKLATKDQINELMRSADRYLRDGKGYRLCTPFKSIDMNIGRLTGFTYGNKEHGSKWMQQNIMLAFGLFKRGFKQEATKIMMDVFSLSSDSAVSRIFPGLPSYFAPADRGAYAYLTGSSTWFILTLTTQVFGVKGVLGDLCMEPNLSPLFFDDQGETSIRCMFRGIPLEVRYSCNDLSNAQHFHIENIKVNGEIPEMLEKNQNKCIIEKTELDKFNNNKLNVIQIALKPD